MFKNIRGKIIAIIYIFENENAVGFGHYDIWKSEVVSGWLNAIESIKCVPYVLDTRTFINKAMNNSLPVIDYVINLNAGNDDLSTLALIPSVCSFLGITCIPCNTVSVIIGEDKKIANLIAENVGLQVPEEVGVDLEEGIFRPLNFGSSKGVRKGAVSQTTKGLYQKFIPGFDITTPLMYNPATKKPELLPTMIYQSENSDTSWFLGENEKATHSGFKRYPVSKIGSDLVEKYKELASSFMINTFCRIDARVWAVEKADFEHLRADGIGLDNIYFIEMNPMPTIRIGNNFYDSIKHIDEHDSFYLPWKNYKDEFITSNEIGFILCCSIMGSIKARC